MAEWGCPDQALKAGFHFDLYLHRDGNAYSRLMRSFEGTMEGEVQGEDHSYFRQTADTSIVPFLSEYLPQYERTKDDGLICFITGNHDVMRPRGNLSPEELKLAYAFLFTMPGVPQIYSGDEIGMRYRKVRSKEGGYYRTGSRTPMQWDSTENLGFSSADAERLYLPVDDAPDAPTVAAQERDPASLLHTVRALLALRRREPALRGNAPFAVQFAREGSRLFVYRRGPLYAAVNPGTDGCAFDAPGAHEVLFAIGACAVETERVRMGPQSFAVLR